MLSRAIALLFIHTTALGRRLGLVHEDRETGAFAGLHADLTAWEAAKAVADLEPVRLAA